MIGAIASLRRSVGQAPRLGSRRFPPIGLVALAMIGASLLLIVALTRWDAPRDEHAYWLAGHNLLTGQPVYDPTAVPDTPYAFWYPPPVAQVMAPVAAVVPSEVFSILWTVLLLGCLFLLAGRKPLVALALIAYVPVAVELWSRNVHLLLAVLIVYAIRGRPWLFAVGAAIKIAPVLGVAYLCARGQWRNAAIAAGVGAVMLAVSVILGVDLWRTFLTVVGPRGGESGASLVAVPFMVRAAVGLVLAIAAGRLVPRFGEPLLVVAITLALPTFWATSLSTLVAIVPIVAANRARP